MIIAVTQPKHGQFCSTVTAALAIAASTSSKVLLVEPTVSYSDLPGILGMYSPMPSAITPVTDTLDFMYGITPLTVAALLTYDYVFIDQGVVQPAPGLADHVVQVMQTAYLPLARAAKQDPPVGPIILIALPAASLDQRDIERAASAPVLATIPYEPAVARAVDAGLLAARSSRMFRDALAALIEYVTTHPKDPMSARPVFIIDDDVADRADEHNEQRQLDREAAEPATIECDTCDGEGGGMYGESYGTCEPCGGTGVLIAPPNTSVDG